MEPAKRRPGCANFAVPEPPLKLVLIECGPGTSTVLDHLGAAVGDTSAERLSGLGLFTRVENDTTCWCARQDEVRVHGPEDEPCEDYTVTGDALGFGPSGAALPSSAAGPGGGVDRSACSSAGDR